MQSINLSTCSQEDRSQELYGTVQNKPMLWILHVHLKFAVEMHKIYIYAKSAYTNAL